MILQAKTRDLQDSVFWNLMAETKEIRPRVPAITKVWKETREKPDHPAPTDKICSHSKKDFQIRKRKAQTLCPALCWLSPLLLTAYIILDVSFTCLYLIIFICQNVVTMRLL